MHRPAEAASDNCHANRRGLPISSLRRMTWATAPSYRWPKHLTAWHRAPLRWLCAAAFTVGYAMGRARAIMKGPAKRILVIRTDGLGDAILFEPAMRSLATRYPNHQLHLWAPAAVCA